jgi:acyl carrier protein
MKITVKQLKHLIKEAISEQMEMASDLEGDGDSLSFQEFISDLEQLDMGAE